MSDGNVPQKSLESAPKKPDTPSSEPWIIIYWTDTAKALLLATLIGVIAVAKSCEERPVAVPQEEEKKK